MVNSAPTPGLGSGVYMDALGLSGP
jgi:hypothetical protein